MKISDDKICDAMYLSEFADVHDLINLLFTEEEKSQASIYALKSDLEWRNFVHNTFMNFFDENFETILEYSSVHAIAIKRGSGQRKTLDRLTIMFNCQFSDLDGIAVHDHQFETIKSQIIHDPEIMNLFDDFLHHNSGVNYEMLCREHFYDLIDGHLETCDIKLEA